MVALALDPSGRTLVSADARSIRTGAAGDPEGELLVELADAERSPIEGLALGLDGRTLFVARRSSVDVWSLATRAQIPARIDPGLSGSPRLAAAPGRLYVGTNNLSVMPWLGHYGQLDALELRDPAALETAEPLPGGLRWGGSLAPQIQLLAAGGTLALVDDVCATAAWDLARGVFLRSSREPSAVFRNCPGERLSADGKTLIVPADLGTMVSVDVATWRTAILEGGQALLAEPPVPGAPKEAVESIQAAGTLAWLDSGGRVHAGPPGGPFRALGKRYRRPPSPPDVSDSVRDPEPRLALSPDGALVAFRAAADRAEIWQTAAGGPVDGGSASGPVDGGTASGPVQVVSRAGISGIAFGADGTAFIAALDGTVTLARAGAARTIVAPDGDPLFALAPLRDGRLVAGAVASIAATAHVWSARDGALRATLRVLSRGAMASAPDGTAELFGPVEGELGCRFGPFVFGLDLCRDRLVQKGALARALDVERTDP